MDPPLHIAQLLNSLARFQPKLVQEEGAYRLRALHNSKVVVVLWPHEISEVFFDFMQDGENIFSESVEYYRGEKPTAQAEEITRVVENYFLNATRTSTEGSLLKRKELQSWRGGNWVSIFQ